MSSSRPPPSHGGPQESEEDPSHRRGVSFLRGERKGDGRAEGSRSRGLPEQGLPTEQALCLFYSRFKEPPSVINQVSMRGFFPCVSFLLF